MVKISHKAFHISIVISYKDMTDTNTKGGKGTFLSTQAMLWMESPVPNINEN